MENNFLEWAYRLLIVPIGYIVWWMFKKYDKRIEELEVRMNNAERENAVLESKIDSLKEGIDDIKRQLNNILGILADRRHRDRD